MKNIFFTSTMSLKEKLLIAISFIAWLVFVYVILAAHVLPFFKIQWPLMPDFQTVKIMSASVIAFTCIWYLRGGKAVLASFLFWVIFAWGIEALSIHTGWPAGNYSYTPNFPGPKLWDTPVLLGFQYFAYYFFMSYFISNLLTNSTPFSQEKDWWKRSLFVSFIASLIVAGVDMMADPVQVNVYHMWQWPKTTPHIGYYGIPYANYAGYVIIFTIFVFVFKYLEIKFKSKPIGPITAVIVAMPLFLHFTRFIEYSPFAPDGVFLVGCFSMFLPCILAADKLKKYLQEAN